MYSILAVGKIMYVFSEKFPNNTVAGIDCFSHKYPLNEAGTCLYAKDFPK
jgi:hypothetical protein